jgi:hypothetical protein
MASKPEYGGFLLGFELLRTTKIAEELDAFGEAVESFSAMDWDFQRREVVLLSLNPGVPGISGIALMERKYGSGGTGKLKMRLFHPVLFSWISQDELGDGLALPETVSTAERLKRIGPATWRWLIAVIRQRRPEAVGAIDALLARREEDRRLFGDGVRTRRLIEQRDALGITLDIANLDRQAELRAMDPGRMEKASSVLDLLDSEPLQEQDVLRRDEEIFRGLLEPSMRHSRFRGRSDDRGVRIHVYDKKPLETVLGIDLLIYLEAFRSFLLVQYKTMEEIEMRRGRTWSYLVDRQMRDQIDAMDRGRTAIQRRPESEGGVYDWRLHESPFYFKFCETTRASSRDDSLVRGIILELGHLTRFLALPESVGENGGRRIGYHNCARYLNNTQFVELAREGWIGCDQRGSNFMREILAANRTGGRQAMLAVVEGRQPLDARRRGRQRR